MIVLFTRKKGLFAWAIRAFTWSDYNHCAALTEDKKHVIESTYNNGVAITCIDAFKARYDTVIYTNLECDTTKALDFMRSRIGDKYDTLAILNLVFRLNRHNRSKWI